VQSHLIPLPELDWIALLREQVEKPGASIASVAREIDMPRPSLSMLLAGTYPAGLDKVTRKYAARVVARYRSEVLCPHLRRGISAAQCRTQANEPMSTHSSEALKFWAACRQCPQNPKGGAV
jgi:hypothetical protein